VTNNVKAIFGTIVTIVNVETDEEITYKIDGQDDAGIRSNLISVDSPIALA
jgi:transcription elongation factor GreA